MITSPVDLQSWFRSRRLYRVPCSLSSPHSDFGLELSDFPVAELPLFLALDLPSLLGLGFPPELLILIF